MRYGEGDVSPPPICLEARDFRGGYEVTTPERTWIAFNWLTHSISPDALFQRFKAVATDALDRAINHFNVEADRFAKLTGNRNDTNHKGRILTTAELCEEVRKVGGNAALERIAALETELSASDNPLLITRELVDRMVAEARITGPTVIIGFGSLVYPHVHMATETDEESRFAEALETARLDAERRFDTTIRYREIFAGISDMSFFGHVPDAMDSEVIAANTPPLNSSIAPIRKHCPIRWSISARGAVNITSGWNGFTLLTLLLYCRSFSTILRIVS